MQPEENEKILRYLLGDLPQAELEQVEERYFCEPEFCDVVIDVEDQLIHRYLDRVLSPVDALLFEGKYFRVPELRGRVELIRGLREASRWSIAQPSGLRQRGHSAWRRMFHRAAAIPALAAVIVVIGIGLRLENARQRTEISLAHSARVAVKADADTGKSRPSSPEEIATLILAPGMTRSAAVARAQRIAWSSSLKEIRIHFELPGLTTDGPLALDVLRVESDERRLILNVRRLRGVATGSGRRVTLSAQPDELVPGDYIAFVKLELGAPSESVLEAYSFAVVAR